MSEQESSAQALSGASSQDLGSERADVTAAKSERLKGAINTPMPQAVIFDLDGTLVDTARDFVRIVVEMCAEAKIEPPSDTQIRHQVSSGAAAMVRLFAGEISRPVAQSGTERSGHVVSDSNLNQSASDADLETRVQALREEFVHRYAEQICVDSMVYPGADELIKALKTRGVKLGIVTNKPKLLTQKLSAALKLDQHFASILSPEDVSQSKPDPEALFLAAKQLGALPERCWYIGDHERDIEAGRRAGMTTVIARYGYIDADAEQDLRAQWQADHQVHSLSELSQLLGLPPADLKPD
jgi:phosphoglycolate phosphatase